LIAIDNGENISSVDNDFEGAIRIDGLTDIGADVFWVSSMNSTIFILLIFGY